VIAVTLNQKFKRHVARRCLRWCMRHVIVYFLSKSKLLISTSYQANRSHPQKNVLCQSLTGLFGIFSYLTQISILCTLQTISLATDGVYRSPLFTLMDWIG
jgi:hypothetical protein